MADNSASDGPSADGTDSTDTERAGITVPAPAPAPRAAKKTVSFTVPAPNLKRPRLQRPQTLRARAAAVAVLFIVAAVLGGFGGAWLQMRHEQNGLPANSLSDQKQIVTNQSQLISRIAQTVGPSVVSVNVDISDSSDSQGQSGFGLFGFSQPEQEEAAGTGIIISSNGLVITNRHVVPEGTTSVSVTLSNGTELKNVSVVGRTSESASLDFAVLKINDLDGQKLTPAVLGDSSQVQVGDAVVAIGNALGQFQNTVTSGIVSGYGRSVEAGDDSSGGSGLGSSSSSSDTESLDDLFQTDAAINEGNSGGPLVNMNGQVIGINTAVAGDAQNIGFAIPINDVRGLINQVLATGHFAQAYLGVRYIPLTADVADEYNLSVQKGAFVAPSNDSSQPSVVSGSPAAKAGLQQSDIITAVNSTNIDQTHSLTSLLDQHAPGDKITLTVLRGGKTLHVSVTLGTMPSSSGS